MLDDTEVWLRLAQGAMILLPALLGAWMIWTLLFDDSEPYF